MSLTPPPAAPPSITVRAGLGVVAMMVRTQPRSFVLACFGATLYAAGSVALSVFLGRAIDQVVLPDPDTVADRTVITMVGFIVAIAVVRAIGVILRRFYAGMTADGVQRTTRTALARTYTDQGLEWHRRHSTGTLLAHADGDTMRLTEALHPLPFSVGVVVLFMLSSAVLVWIDPWIALFALAGMPLISVGNHIYTKRVEAPMSRVQELSAEVTGIAHESLTGAVIVRTLGRADTEIRRFETAATELHEQRRRVSFLHIALGAAIEAIPSLVTIGAVAIGLWRLSNDAMTAGDIVIVAALFGLLAMPLRVFGFLFESLAPAVVAWRRIEPVSGPLAKTQPARADGPIATAAPQRPQPQPHATGARLAVSELSYRFADSTAPDADLRDISFTVEPGELIAVVGATASGKSTLFSLLSGLTAASGGTIAIDGVDVDSMDTDERVAAVGIALQQAHLFVDSVRNNLDPMQRVTDETVRKAAETARIYERILTLDDGWDTLVGERGHTFSGGERQRLALARVIAQNPRLLLLDDPTSAVDPVVERAIMADLRANPGITVVLATHRLAAIASADRVIHLADGTVANVGPHKELLADPSYRALVMAWSAT